MLVLYQKEFSGCDVIPVICSIEGSTQNSRKYTAQCSFTIYRDPIVKKRRGLIMFDMVAKNFEKSYIPWDRLSFRSECLQFPRDFPA
jgi:hypothetical protein